MQYGNRVRRPRRSARALLRPGVSACAHVAFGIVMALGLSAPSLGQERDRQAPEMGLRSERPLAPSPAVDLPSKELSAPLPSQIYAAALLAGLGEPESVRIEMRALIAEADERFLRELYANAVLAGFESPGVVRQRIRVAGIQGEHVTRYPDEVVNRVYAVSVLVGNAEDVETIRNALDRMIERPGSVVSPFVSCPDCVCPSCGGADDPFGFNDGCGPGDMRDEYGQCRDMNQIIDDMIRRELEHAGGPATLILDLAANTDWEEFTNDACSVISTLSTLGTFKNLWELAKEVEDNKVLSKKFWKIFGRWAGRWGLNIVAVRTAGGAVDLLNIGCWLRRYL